MCVDGVHRRCRLPEGCQCSGEVLWRVSKQSCVYLWVYRARPITTPDLQNLPGPASSPGGGGGGRGVGGGGVQRVAHICCPSHRCLSLSSRGVRLWRWDKSCTPSGLDPSSVYREIPQYKYLMFPTCHTGHGRLTRAAHIANRSVPIGAMFSITPISMF